MRREPSRFPRSGIFYRFARIILLSFPPIIGIKGDINPSSRGGSFFGALGFPVGVLVFELEPKPASPLIPGSSQRPRHEVTPSPADGRGKTL